MSQEETPVQTPVPTSFAPDPVIPLELPDLNDKKARLLKELRQLIVNVDDGVYDDDLTGEIRDIIRPFITGERNECDILAIQYLMRGWWISDGIRRIGNNEEPLLHSNEGAKLPFCPWCCRAQIQSDHLEESGT